MLPPLAQHACLGSFQSRLKSRQQQRIHFATHQSLLMPPPREDSEENKETLGCETGWTQGDVLLRFCLQQKILPLANETLQLSAFSSLHDICPHWPDP